MKGVDMAYRTSKWLSRLVIAIGVFILASCALKSSMLKPSGYYNQGSVKYYFTQGAFYDIESKPFSVDEATFKVLQRTTPGYAVDKDFVYLGGGIIKDADPKTFAILNRDYTKDQFYVYYKGRRIERASPRSFSLITTPSWIAIEEWGRDEESAYFRGEKQEICDLNTFKVLGERWAKDAKCVYGGYINKLDRLDAPTFEVINSECGRDIQGYWMYSSRDVTKSTKEACAKFN